MTPPTDERRLLLASASPRRRHLLNLLGVRFTVTHSRFDESSLSHIADPVEYVRRAAEEKAREVARRRDGIILGSDTDVVAPDGTILGKPKDNEDAARMLRSLSGRTHRVCSGIALIESRGGEILRADSRVIETGITFADLPDAVIAAYIATGEPADKAGAYGIQGGAMAFVTKVDGDLSSVIGLPLWPLAEMLQAFGVPLWDFPKDSGDALAE